MPAGETPPAALSKAQRKKLAKKQAKAVRKVAAEAARAAYEAEQVALHPMLEVGAGKAGRARMARLAGGRGRRDSMIASQECRLVSMHGLLRLLRLLIRAQLIR